MTCGSGYLVYEEVMPRGLTHPRGLKHALGNLICLLREARASGRLAVLPRLRLHPYHNFGVDREWRWDTYFDFERSVLADAQGEYPLPLADRDPGADVTSLVLDPGDPLPLQDATNPPRIIRRFSESDTAMPFHRQVPPEGLSGARPRFASSANVVALAAPVVKHLAALDEGGFVAVHVRRRDRIQKWLPEGGAGTYPSWMTEPESIRDHLHACGYGDGSTLFLSSDEPRADFWDPLAKHYRLVRYVDFPELARLVSRRDGSLPDNYLLFQVEQEVMKSARLWIETRPVGNRLVHGTLISEDIWRKINNSRRRRWAFLLRRGLRRLSRLRPGSGGR